MNYLRTKKSVNGEESLITGDSFERVQDSYDKCRRKKSEQ